MSDTTKTMAQRIKDGAAAVRALRQDVEWTHEMIAKAVLEAADAPPKPEWPTDESVARFKAAYRSSTNRDVPMNDEWVRDCLRESMTVDPIHKAAIGLRDAHPQYHHPDQHKAIVDAVNEAGL